MFVTVHALHVVCAMSMTNNYLIRLLLTPQILEPQKLLIVVILRVQFRLTCSHTHTQAQKSRV